MGQEGRRAQSIHREGEGGKEYGPVSFLTASPRTSVNNHHHHNNETVLQSHFPKALSNLYSGNRSFILRSTMLTFFSFVVVVVVVVVLRQQSTNYSF